ncbi:hypothetical protein ACVWZ3_002614 [Bradyrhizobium sp. i1.3.6]
MNIAVTQSDNMKNGSRTSRGASERIREKTCPQANPLCLTKVRMLSDVNRSHTIEQLPKYTAAVFRLVNVAVK